MQTREMRKLIRYAFEKGGKREVIRTRKLTKEWLKANKVRNVHAKLQEYDKIAGEVMEKE